MSKTVCKKKKKKEVPDPKFSCKKCNAIATKKKDLCKPKKHPAK
jgi:hypothetical protein